MLSNRRAINQDPGARQQKWLRLVVPLCAVLLFSSLRYRIPLMSDDVVAMATVSAFVDRGTLAITPLRWLDDQVGIGASGPDGQLYSKYGIGEVILATPLYAVGKLIPSLPLVILGHTIAESQSGVDAALMLNALVMGGLLWVLQLLVEDKWGIDGSLAAVAAAMTTPLFVVGRTFGTEVVTALCLALAMLACLRGKLALGMLCVGLAALFRPAAIVFAAGWVVLLINCPRKTWLHSALMLALGVMAIGLHNQLRFGSPFASGYARDLGFSLQADGFLGFLISPGRSLVLFAPWVLLTAPMVLQAIRTRDKFCLGLLLGAAVYIATHAAWREWYGGWAYGPRLLAPIIPLLAVLAAPQLVKLRALPLLLAGLAVELVTVSLNPFTVLGNTIRSGITLDQTIWSLEVSTLALQGRALLASRTDLLITLAAMTGFSLILVFLLYCARPRTTQAR